MISPRDAKKKTSLASPDDVAALHAALFAAGGAHPGPDAPPPDAAAPRRNVGDVVVSPRVAPVVARKAARADG